MNRIPANGGFEHPRNHDERRYNAAHGMLTHQRDTLPQESIEALERVRAELVEKMEREQPLVSVRDAVRRITEQGPRAGAQDMTGAHREKDDADQALGGDTC